MAHGGTLAPVRTLLALVSAGALVVGIAPTVAAQAGPLPEAAPTVPVTPDPGLGDEQVVAVHGEGFADSRGYLTYVECAADGDLFSDNCRGAETGSEVPSDVHADGSFDGTYRVDAQYYTDDGDLIDCRVAPGCVLRMDSAFGPVDLPLAFDPSAPLAPPPVLTATPDTDLTDGTRVQLELTGFRPGGWLFLYLCPGTARSATRSPSRSSLMMPVTSLPRSSCEPSTTPSPAHASIAARWTATWWPPRARPSTTTSPPASRSTRMLPSPPSRPSR